MITIPQAIANESARVVVAVCRDAVKLAKGWGGGVPTVDAPGIATHPREIRVGDIIDGYVTGWTREAVLAVAFRPGALHLEGYHCEGTYTFTIAGGFRSVRVDGRQVTTGPLYRFPQP